MRTLGLAQKATRLNLSIRTSLDGSIDSLRDGADGLRSEARREGGSERLSILSLSVCCEMVVEGKQEGFWLTGVCADGAGAICMETDVGPWSNGIDCFVSCRRLARSDTTPVRPRSVYQRITSIIDTDPGSSPFQLPETPDTGYIIILL